VENASAYGLVAHYQEIRVLVNLVAFVSKPFEIICNSMTSSVIKIEHRRPCLEINMHSKAVCFLSRIRTKYMAAPLDQIFHAGIIRMWVPWVQITIEVIVPDQWISDPANVRIIGGSGLLPLYGRLASPTGTVFSVSDRAFVYWGCGQRAEDGRTCPFTHSGPAGGPVTGPGCSQQRWS
jgi:hypothetical protein